MAATNRFSLLSEDDLNRLSGHAFNENTKRSTQNWIGVYRQWASERGRPHDPEQLDPEELDKVLGQFFGELRKQNGDEYEPDSLRVMQASISRYLLGKKYEKNILSDLAFQSSRNILEGKARLLRQKGMGKRPNASRALTPQEEGILWSLNRLGGHDSLSLLRTMWFNNTLHFGLRGRQEHVVMTVENFRFRQDDEGIEFIEFLEDPTKTRPSGLTCRSRVTCPKMFATSSANCPVQLFKLYLSKRPADMRESGRFYLQPKQRACKGNSAWYNRTPVGKNSLSSMMKDLVSGTDIDPSKLTNHSGRKTLVQKMKKAKVPESSIIKVTGHSTTGGLRNYDPGDEGEFRAMSSAISNTPAVSRKQPLRGPPQSFSGDHGPLQSFSVVNEPPQSFSGVHGPPQSFSGVTSQGQFIFQGCYTVNFNSITQTVSRKRKCVIYDSSESSQSQ